MSSRTAQFRTLFVSAVALVVWSAETCGQLPVVRILTPKPGLDAIYEPLLLEIDLWAFADMSTFQVVLNGVDVTDSFELEDSAGGRVLATAMDIWGGGVPSGASPDPDGIFTLALDLTNELLPGEYQLTVTAFIEDTGGGAGREISAPLTLLVAAPGALFADGFESGDFLEWSTNVP